jgi:hypothetical protein
MAAVYTLGKLKGKYLIQEVLSFAYFFEDSCYLLYSASKTLRYLLTHNVHILRLNTVSVADVPV